MIPIELPSAELIPDFKGKNFRLPFWGKQSEVKPIVIRRDEAKDVAAAKPDGSVNEPLRAAE